MKSLIAILFVFTATYVMGQPGASLASAQTVAAVAPADQEMEIIRQANAPRVQVKFAPQTTPASLQVVNGEGAEILSVPVEANTSSLTVSIQNMPAGLYFLRLMVGGNSVATKSLWID